MRKNRLVLALALFAGATAPFAHTLYAQTVEIKDAWVRTTVPGQKATGAFMKITAQAGDMPAMDHRQHQP